MTPAELNLYVRSYVDRERDKYHNDLSLAWMTAYYHRVEKMPDIATTYPKGTKQKKKEQTADDMLAIVMKLNAKFGGTSG